MARRSYSPDGKKLALTLSGSNGNLDVYLLDLGTQQLTRLTDDQGIDTEAVFAPDGSALYFTSDRSGSPQVYKLTLGSSERPRRITFSGSYNARPRVSPDGKQLALLTLVDGSYRIATQDLSNGTVTGAVEGPPGRIAELRAERRDADLRRPRSRPGRIADSFSRRTDLRRGSMPMRVKSASRFGGHSCHDRKVCT